MNKKLLSLAVAAAIAAPTAVLADANFYGTAHVSIDYFDQYQNGTGTHHTGWTLSKGRNGRGNERASRLGVKGFEDFGSGLKAIYQIEFGIPMANEEDYDLDNGEQGTIKMRNSYVGVQGSAGTLLIGRHDTPLKSSTSKLDLFDDRMADYQGTLGFNDVRADNIITYISDIGGVKLATAFVPGGASTIDSNNGNLSSDGLTQAFSLAATYESGPWYGSAAYQLTTSELSASSVAPKKSAKVTRFGLGIRDLNGLYLSGIYEKQKNFDFLKDNDVELWQVQAGYEFGNSMLKGMYGQKDPDMTDFQSVTAGNLTLGTDTQTTTSWAIGIDHSFTKRTKAYALYTDVDVDNTSTTKNLGDWNGFSLGMIHDF